MRANGAAALWRAGKWIQERAWRVSARRTFAGVDVRLFWPMEGEAETSFARMEEALELVARHDPRSLARLRRHARGVWILGDVGPVGEWRYPLGLVRVRATFAAAETTSAARLAGVVVHEATHAWLWSLGIGYPEPLRARVERVCIRAERRFLRRVPGAEEHAAAAETWLHADPVHWTDAAFRSRATSALREGGLPNWLIGWMVGRSQPPA